MQLSEYCINVCEVLKGVIQGGGDFTEFEKMVMEDLER